MSKNQPNNIAPLVSLAPLVFNDNEQTTPKIPKFVVIRDGYRVSDKDYPTQIDEMAKLERDYWQKLSNNHSWGEKVSIVQYDSKYHRVW